MVMVVIPKNVQIWMRIKTSRKYKLFCGRYSNALKRRQIKSPRNRKWIKILLSRKDIGHVCVVLVELQWAPGIVSASIQRAVSCIEIFFGFRIYTVCIQLLNFLCDQMTEYLLINSFFCCIHVNCVHDHKSLTALWQMFWKCCRNELYCNVFQVNLTYF